MKLIYDILSKLHIDQTFFAQFALVIVLFFAVKFLLMAKLQEVLDLREGKTTKREEGANDKFNQAEELATKYASRITEANQKAQKNYDVKKDEVNKKMQETFKDAAKITDSEMQVKREKNFKEVEEHKVAMNGNKEGLVQDLIAKVTK